MKKGIMILLVFVLTFFGNYFNSYAAESYYWPVPSCQKVTSGRGYSSTHDAIDIPAGIGSPVYATKTGTIKHFFNSCGHTSQGIGHNCNNSWGAGNGLYILHDDGTWAEYAHMQLNSFPSYIGVGQRVTQGQYLGNTGSAGQSTGPHLHFGIKQGNTSSFWSSAGVNNNPDVISYVYDYTPSIGQTIQLWAIADGDVIRGVKKIWAKRSDDDSNHYAIFYLDGEAISGQLTADSNGFFSCVIDSSWYADGNHKLEIYYANSTSSSTDSINVNFEKKVQLWELEEGQQIGSPQYIYAKRFDSDSNHYAQFYMDDNEITGYLLADSNDLFSVYINPDDYTEGLHQIKVKYANSNSSWTSVRMVNIVHTTNGTTSEFPLINNGIYKIRNVHSGKVIDIPLDSIVGGTVLHQWEDNGESSQRWRAIQHDDGYSFVSVYSGKAMDIMSGAASEGASLTQYDYNQSDAQRFKLVYRGDGQYSIQPLCSDLTLDIYNNSIDNGAEIRQYPYQGDDNQLFIFEYAEDSLTSEFPLINNGIYKIRNVHSGKLIDIPLDSIVGGTVLHQWEDNGESSQRWRAIQHNDGYSFVSIHSGKAMDIMSGTTSEGASLTQYDYNQSDAQRFKLLHKGDGRYSIHPVCSDLALDVRGGTRDNGAEMMQYTYFGFDNQLWTFEEVEVPEPTPSTLPFTDVPQGSWYYDYVVNVYENGYMVGSGATFKPAGLLTRAEIVTTLYSMNGKPATEAVNNFADVPSGQWYSTPISWAYRNNIASGYANGKFGTTDLITREQFAVMLYQYATSYGYSTACNDSALNGYTDAGAISSWANTAMKWAVSNEIISGKTATTLDPRGNATRAECATMITKLGRLRR